MITFSGFQTKLEALRFGVKYQKMGYRTKVVRDGDLFNLEVSKRVPVAPLVVVG